MVLKIESMIGENQRERYLLTILKHVGKIEGRTRFQKMIFLGQEELGLPQLFDFSIHYYGPYSVELTRAIERLLSQGYIVEDVEEIGDYIRYTYRLSERGKAEAERERAEISDESIQILKTLSEAPLSAILAYVYSKYIPDTAQ